MTHKTAPAPSGTNAGPARFSRPLTAFNLVAALVLAFLFAGSAARGQQDLAELEEQAIKAAVAQVAPAVVRIEALAGLEQVGGMLVGEGPTSGLVVSADGYVLSSGFGFVQQPSSILVTLPGNQRVTAEIVARDRSRMLVMLKVNTAQALPEPVAVPREEMAVGQWAIAVGRTFDGEAPNLSVGVLSAINRIWGRAVQTDAKVSPANYGGPLIDIQGRVLGVLVPLSPQAESEIAGVEWYDSGIGFAVPLADILPQLEKLKRGQDLHPGILGVALQGGDIYADPAEIAAVLPKSPAWRGGLKAGDRIVAADRQPVERQAQLKHVLGRKYAGESLELVVNRGSERIETRIELAEKIEPYEHPFLGLLPDRNSEPGDGVPVRLVYADSPAARAGMEPGDRLLALVGQRVADADAARQVLANLEPGQSIRVEFRRGGEQEVEAALGRLPEGVPDELPPRAVPAVAANAGQRPPVGKLPIEIVEESSRCFAYVPESYRAGVPHGVVLWLREPGAADDEALIQDWKDACERFSLILLAPRSEDPARWLPTESDYVRRTLEQLAARYDLDRARVVAAGTGAGGGMAWLVALGQRDWIRGVAVADAAVPQRLQLPPNDPIARLAVWLLVPQESPTAGPMRGVADRLRAMKYPVTLREYEGQASGWTADQRAEIARWTDTLDRL